MRLLFVIDSLGSGGAQRQLVALAAGLSSRGHSIEFFVYHPQYRHFAAQLEGMRIPIHCVSKAYRWSLGPVRALRALLQERPYDALLGFLPTPSLYCELARLRGVRPPLIISERTTYTAGSLGLRGWLQRQAHRLADHITVNSHSQRERMERIFPWMRTKITTIYNGVDLETFRPSGVMTRAKELQLLAIGALAPHKNALALIRAIAISREQSTTSCTVRWAGRIGGQSDAEFMAAQRLLGDLGLKERWHWLGERTDVPQLMQSHDALIHPSVREGLPNALCEALASGLPVLAGRISDNARLVQDGATGFLFDSTDPSDMAAAIQRLDRLSTATCVAFRRRARAYAVENLGLGAYAAKYEQLFRAVTDESGLSNGSES
jgi:glycosyltransferase involved in cell wall biosynthesis